MKPEGAETVKDEVNWSIEKLREVAADLRDKPTLRGHELEHQARKLDEVIRRLSGEPEATPQDGPPPVHGGGTGNQ